MAVSGIIGSGGVTGGGNIFGEPLLLIQEAGDYILLESDDKIIL